MSDLLSKRWFDSLLHKIVTALYKYHTLETACEQLAGATNRSFHLCHLRTVQLQISLHIMSCALRPTLSDDKVTLTIIYRPVYSVALMLECTDERADLELNVFIVRGVYVYLMFKHQICNIYVRFLKIVTVSPLSRYMMLWLSSVSQNLKRLDLDDYETSANYQCVVIIVMARIPPTFFKILINNS